MQQPHIALRYQHTYTTPPNCLAKTPQSHLHIRRQAAMRRPLQSTTHNSSSSAPRVLCACASPAASHPMPSPLAPAPAPWASMNCAPCRAPSALLNR